MKRTVIPWIIAALVGGYVFGLTYHAKHKPPPDPVYDFYDTTIVQVYISHFMELPDVYGRYNNIVEGERKLVEAESDNAGYYELAFKVNSPRPAILYVDDAAIEVFLVPDSTLSIYMHLNPNTNGLDSLRFAGYTSGICKYYQEKSQQFSEVQSHLSRNTFNSEDFPTFARELDSTVAIAQNFLEEYTTSHELPSWFLDFELSEILYQKAYLKLSNAYKRGVADKYLDDIEINNEGAVFSYYYYLYLKSFISTYYSPDENAANDQLQAQRMIKSQMSVADTLLVGEMHDVFLTRIIFQQLKQNQMDFVEELLNAYQGKFNKKKYERFLGRQYRIVQNFQ